MLGAGIAVWFILPTPAGWRAAMLAGLALAVAGMIASGLVRRVLVFAGLLFALGIGLAWNRAEMVRAPRLAEGRVLAIVAADVLAVESRPASNRTRLLIGNIVTGPDDYRELPPGLVARISVRGDLADAVSAGARIRVRVSLAPPPGPNIPGGYHFARRAWFDGIGAVGQAFSSVTVIRPAPVAAGIVRRFETFRAGLTRSLQDGVGGRAGGLAAALVTGDRGGIADPVTEAMRDSGLAHLIAISGLHIAIVVGGVLWCSRRLLALSPWLSLNFDTKAVAAVFAAFVGVSYTLIAGAAVPTIRACIAVLIALVGLVSGREAITLRMVAAAAFAILIWRPEYLLGPSFQLSFAAVTAIVALYQSPLGRKFSAPGEHRFATRLFRGAAALLVTSLVAELALGPIAIFHFNQMGLYGMVANLVAIPLTSFIILPLLVLALFMDAVGLGMPVYWMLGHAIEALIRIAEVTAAVPGAVTRLPSMTGWSLAFIVCGGIWLCLWETRRRWLGAGVAMAGIAAMLAARPPDIMIDGQGKHVAVIDGGIALLRPRAGDYVRSMWQDAAGMADSGNLDSLDAARCTVDSCTARIVAGGRGWSLLATRSTTFIDRDSFAPACAQADIVVSDRRLPDWCTPRWLKLDRTMLAKTGAMTIWLGSGRIRTVADEDGQHPWAEHSNPASCEPYRL